MKLMQYLYIHILSTYSLSTNIDNGQSCLYEFLWYLQTYILKSRLFA